MPIFEYQCNDCDRCFEFLVLGNEGPKKCPECAGDKIEKLMSACGFFSKGGSGETLKASASTSGCSGCSATSCSSCGH